jgi:hypothetical protein
VASIAGSNPIMIFLNTTLVISLSSLDREGPDRPLSEALRQKLIIPRKSQLREERDPALFLICSIRIAPAAALDDACRE